MNWIMEPFNPLFCAVFAAFLLLLVAASLLLRGKKERTRQIVLISTCAVTFAAYFIYKYALSLDAEFDILTADTGGFNWWGELPIQLCNISMILIPIAVLKKSRPLMSFCFFIGPLGALMALIMPGTGFSGYSLLLPRMLGYYGTHFMIVIEGWALMAFGLFRPRFSDLPKVTVSFCSLGLAIFGVNMLLRWSGLHPSANYFFLVETEGNPILDMFYRLIPVPFLYALPCIGILVVYIAAVTALLGVVDKLRGKEVKKS